MEKLLYLPIEVGDRELHSRILLTAEAVSRGHTVVIGAKPLIEKIALWTKLPGVMMWKSIPHVLAKEAFRNLRAIGIRSIVQDEEAGIAYGKFEDFVKVRPSFQSLPLVDAFMCWGPEDYEYLRSLHESPSGATQANVVLTGGARAALWGKTGEKYFSVEIKAIREAFGDFILFATNFASAKSHLGTLRYRRFSKTVNSNAGYQNLQERTVTNDEKNILLFRESIQAVLLATSMNVVIRPHPAEDPNYLKDYFRNESRVLVQATGDATPLLLAAKIVIHNSSTTALQASGTGAELIALGPTGFENATVISTPNSISHIVNSGDELVCLLKKLPLERNVNSEKVLERKVFQKGNAQIVRNIVDVVETLSISIDRDLLSSVPIKFRLYSKKLWLGDFVYRLLPKAAVPTAIRLAAKKRPRVSRENFLDYLHRAHHAMGLESSSTTVTRLGGKAFIVRPHTI